MSIGLDPPRFPAGEFVSVDELTPQDRKDLIDLMRRVPGQWNQALTAIPDQGLDRRYRNWTIRQITHHIADSHANSYIRFKWTLTEDQPLIKAYDEAAWVALGDSAHGTIEEPLLFLAGIHAQWCQLLDRMTEADFSRHFVHPETSQAQRLDDVLQYYPWHSRHHLGQVLWLAEKNDWAVPSTD